LPSSPEEKAHFTEAARDTIDAVENFRDDFNTFFVQIRNAFPDPSAQASTEDVAAVQHPFRPIIQVRPFSDALMISACLVYGKAPQYPRVVDILETIVGAAAAFRLSLKRKEVFRGGIDVGVGTQLHDADVYGPVLVNAYRLEDTVAQWPRIVVGTRLVDYLRSAISEDSGDEIGETLSLFAKQCLELIDIDADGQRIVDYLGAPMRGILVDDEAEFESEVKAAYSFISAEHERFSNADNPKLALRYAILRRYFLDKCGDILEPHS
ncbi:MAG: hypothetical protein IID36_11595, partial [Planctomycetes bacterium]|nr:hypothetical protein [Planctomycetota bacterium]